MNTHGITIMIVPNVIVRVAGRALCIKTCILTRLRPTKTFSHTWNSPKKTIPSNQYDKAINIAAQKLTQDANQQVLTDKGRPTKVCLLEFSNLHSHLCDQR